jgi:hypothetical protein
MGGEGRNPKKVENHCTESTGQLLLSDGLLRCNNTNIVVFAFENVIHWLLLICTRLSDIFRDSIRFTATKRVSTILILIYVITRSNIKFRTAVIYYNLFCHFCTGQNQFGSPLCAFDFVKFVLSIFT